MHCLCCDEPTTTDTNVCDTCHKEITTDVNDWCAERAKPTPIETEISILLLETADAR